MKVGFSGFVLDGGQSGIASYVIELLNALQNVDKDNSYDVFVTKADEHLLADLKENFTVKTHHPIFSRPIPSILWHNISLPLFAMKYDIIHVPTIRRVPMIKGCRLIATIHDMAPFVLKDKYDPFRTFYHRHVLSRCIHRCDHIIAVSETTKNDIIRFTHYPEEKISVVYSGLNPFWKSSDDVEKANNLLKEKYQITQPFFVYVSRVEHPAKNHLRLIKAFEKFKKRFQTPHQLVFAGADWFGAEVVKRDAHNSPFRSDILFLGFIPDQDVKALYSTCEQMIFPSLYEGFGFPVLEALACGVPVACSNTSALAEIANGYADLFDPYNVDDIAAVMIKSALEKKATKQCREAINYAHSFTWEKTAWHVLENYRRLGN